MCCRFLFQTSTYGIVTSQTNQSFLTDNFLLQAVTQSLYMLIKRHFNFYETKLNYLCMTSTFNVIIPISPTVSDSITILLTRFTNCCTIEKSELYSFSFSWFLSNPVIPYYFIMKVLVSEN